MVAPHTAGDPMGHGRGLNCRLRDVQERLDEAGHGVGLPVISRLLQKHDYRLTITVCYYPTGASIIWPVYS
jgi:hypothetical protein